PEARRTPSADFSVAVLPLGAAGSGCLVAISEHPGGFGTDDRSCLELIARAVSAPAARGAAADGGELPPDAFSLAMDTGRVEVGDAILGLFGITRDEFDGRVETLLGLTEPEDLPALMSVVEADHMSIGDRELDFRILQPSGPPRWLRLRGRL